MVDKKINEKDFLPGQQLPIEIVPVKDAWTEMQKKLEDEMPGAAIGLQSTGINKRSLQKRILRISLLLLLLLITWVFISQLNKDGVGSREMAVTKKNSIVKKQSTKKQAIKEDIPATTSQVPMEKQSGNSPNYEVAIRQEPINKFTGKNSQQKNDQQKKINREGKKKNNAGKKSLRSSKREKVQKPSLDTPDTAKETLSGNDMNEQQAITDEPVIDKNISLNSMTDTITKKEAIKDSLENAVAEEKISQDKPVVSAGLQWNLQLPVYRAADYFKGSSARSQPYSVLLPGAWISINVEKHLLRAEVNPFYSSLLPAKPFGTFTTYTTIPDTIITVTETKTLRKTFGILTSWDYNYNISNNWWLGGGIHAYWLRKGIASGSGTEERRSLINGGAVSGTFNRNYVLTKSDWENFDRFQLGVHGEFSYSSKKIQTALRIGLPIGNIAKDEGQKTSLRTEVIFRLPLFFSDNK